MMRLFFVLLFTLWLSDTAFGATPEVGGGSQRAGIVTTSGADDFADLAFPGSVTTGNLLVVGGTAYDSTGAPDNIVVTAPCATFAVLSSAPAGVTRQFIAYGIATSTGACTVRVNPEGSGDYVSFGIDEFTTMALDVDDGQTSGTDTTATATITTAGANALILAVFTQGTDQAVITPDGSMTVIAEDDDNTTAQCYSFTFKIAATVSAYDMEWSIDHSVSWRIHTASFAVAGSAVNKQRIMVLQ